MFKIRPLLLSLCSAACALLASPAASSARTDVQVNINGYLPAPPGVVVQVSSGRPYYVEQGQRVYLVRDKHHHGKKRHHEDRGHHYGEEKHGGHEKHGGGHGR